MGDDTDRVTKKSIVVIKK